MAADRRNTRRNTRLAFYPAFGAADAAEFTDQFHRVQFYANPVADHIAEIALVRDPDLTVGEMPHYFDPLIRALAPRFDGKIRFVDPADAQRACADADIILHWNTSAPLPPALARKTVKNVDRHRYIEECQQWLTLSIDVGGAYDYLVDESREKYRALVARCKSKRAYVFGTGPNLALAAHHDYSQGVAVVCNSMVKNTTLLDRIRPPLIVACDPIFHGGASTYAAEFRTALYAAMERYGAYFLCNQRDFRVFRALMPEALRERLIGAPHDWGLAMKADTVERFMFTACPNVLTLFLLPIAAALAEEEIFVAGCDGRPLGKNEYFWPHDKSVQFNDKMAPIQEAHPSFFDLSYDDYYFLHCETVAAWIRKIEARGLEVANVTPSFIPALRARFVQLDDVEKGRRIEEDVPFLTRLRMRRVYLQRQWTAFRHGLLPRWKYEMKQAVKRPLRWAGLA